MVFRHKKNSMVFCILAIWSAYRNWYNIQNSCNLKCFKIHPGYIDSEILYFAGMPLACFNKNRDESKQNCWNCPTFGWFQKCQVKGTWAHLHCLCGFMNLIVLLIIVILSRSLARGTLITLLRLYLRLWMQWVMLSYYTSITVFSLFSHRLISFSFFSFLKQIETPKDVQEKFGRTVVESYLLWPVSYNFVRLAFFGSYSFRELGEERVCSALDQINFGI